MAEIVRTDALSFQTKVAKTPYLIAYRNLEDNPKLTEQRADNERMFIDLMSQLQIYLMIPVTPAIRIHYLKRCM